jgi:hypothetical protein
MSTFYLEQVLIRAGEDSINGVDSLPVDFEEVVTRTFETGKIVERPERKVEALKKPKKARAKKPAMEEETEKEAAETTKAMVKVEELEHALEVKPEDAALNNEGSV